MAITLEEITERVKGRINETVSGDIHLSEVRHWVHPKLFQIFKDQLPHTKWYGGRTTFTAEWVGKSSESGLLTGGNTIAGFTGLTVNECRNWNAYIKHQNGKFYIDQVASNGTDYIILVGTSDLPSSGLVTCIVSQASTATLSEINLSSLDYFNITKIVGPDGLIVKAKNEEELDIVPENKTVYANQLRWWEIGRKLLFAKGEGADYPSSATVWSNRNPIKATENTDPLDMPDDWEEALIGLVASVALRKLEGKAEEATREENAALGLLKQMEEASLKRKLIEEVEEEK